MSRIGAYTPETARQVLQVVRYLQQSGFRFMPQGSDAVTFQPETPVYVRNDTMEVIPPFACMQVTGTHEEGGQNYIKVQKPNGAASAKYLFNGVAPIPSASSAERFGIGYAGPLIRVLTDGSSIALGDGWQPVSGQWYVEPGGNLIYAIGADDIGADVVRGFVNIDTGKQVYFRAPVAGVPAFNGSTGQMGSASCEEMSLNGSGLFSATGNFQTVYNESGWIPSSSLIIAELSDSGIWVGRPPSDVLYQYELRTNWYGGMALAYVKSMDGASFGQTVLIRNPLGEASYQKAGDKGEMIFKPGTNQYFWIQAPCGTTNTPPAGATGACCYTTSEGWLCVVSTEADCDDIGGTYKGDGTNCETSSCP